MRKKEILIACAALALVVLSVLIGSPAKENDGQSNTARVYAGVATITPASGSSITPILTTTPTASGTPSGSVTPTASGTPSPTQIPVTGIPSATPSPTPLAPITVDRITAYYNGATVEIGDDLDRSKLMVTAYYSDGSFKELDGGYQVPDTKVTAMGQNKFLAIYQGKTAVFYVQGMKLTTIYAITQRVLFGLYNGLSSRDVVVTAIYSDGSTRVISGDKYTVEPAKFTTSGYQKVTIKYKEATTTVQVNVEAEKPIKALSVSYEDPSLPAGEKIDRNKVVVTAVYNDALFSTERIETYTMDVTKFERAGTGKLTVNYRGLSASCEINVIERKVSAFKAEYKGGDIEIGDEVARKDIVVTATYNENIETVTEEYDIFDPVIRYLGENQIKISIGDYFTYITVTGIEAAPIDFSHVSKFELRSGEYDFTISTAIPQKLGTNAITGVLTKKTKLTKAYRKLKSKTGWFCGFSFEFADDNNEVYLPVSVRISLPEGMEPEYTELYYTPNKKSIVGRMNKSIVDANTMEVLVFKTGIYMIVYDPEAYKEDVVEDD